MGEMITERRSVIDWFKTGFSEEARATTKTSRLQDGRLSYRFSVTNTSDFDFNDFSFKVKVVNRDTGEEIGSASISAGEWMRGETKSFKSRLSIPDDVRNISFVMFAESIEYDVRGEDSLGSAVREMEDAARNMGETVMGGGEGMGSILGELFADGGMPETDGSTVTKTTTTQRTANGRTTTRTTTTTRQQNTGRQTARPSGSRSPSANTGPGQTGGTFIQRRNKKKLDKKRMGKSGWIIAGIVTGVIFALAAAGSYYGTAEQLSYGIVALVSFAASAIGKYVLSSKAKRIRQYEARVNKNGNTSIDDICAYVGRPFNKVADELHQMIVDGFFPDAYVDIENRLLVMTKNGQPIEDVARSAAESKKARRKAARESGAVPESLDDLITMTDDTEIKGKLKSLRIITKKIDARVEAVPDLEKQVKDFREKYYPEVVRLTDEYNEKIVDMGKYGEENAKPEVSEDSSGAHVLNTNPNYLQEQANEIKTQLISLIDSVTEASENLLEKLHEDDIMDITTDIKMLQTTLASKGLLDSDFDVK